MKKFEEINNLIEALKRASSSYYNDSISLMSDAEYDSKKDHLQDLYRTVLIPKKKQCAKQIAEVEKFFTQIGAPIVPSEWNKVAHIVPMTSLNKVNKEHEFVRWTHEIGDQYYVIFDKMDGGSIDLVYENGKLVQALTRGDGTEGEDMLINVLKMQNVKKMIPGFTGNLYGEVVITRDDFETLNSNSNKEYKNPRNTANGLQKALDGINVELLSILFYNIRGLDSVQTEEEKLQTIESFGLKTCFWKKVTVKEAISIYYEYHKEIRSTLPYDIDGLVIRANSIKLQEKHGMLGGNPKAHIAWKFPPMQRETILLDIEWSVGNSRRITPVAILKPVDMGGVTVRRCSLHNVSIFKSLKLKKGCTVLVERANDVIPYLVENRSGGTKEFEIPSVCPACSEPVSVEEKFLICNNDNCSGLEIGNLEKWIKVLNIDSIGPRIIQLLYEKKLVTEPADFYVITTDQVAGLDRMGKRSAEKVINNLKAKMEITLPELIAGLNMLGWGKEIAQTLVDAGYDSIEKMCGARKSNLIQVKGIGYTTADQIVHGLESKADVMKHLFQVGIIIKESQKVVLSSNKLAGKSFCFTGAIQATKTDGKRYTRDDMHALVLANGGTVATRVSSGLSYLVMVDVSSTSGKAKKARDLGTALLRESEFFEMLK